MKLTDKEICEKFNITQAELERRREQARDLNAEHAERACGISREEYARLPMVRLAVCCKCGTGRVIEEAA